MSFRRGIACLLVLTLILGLLPDVVQTALADGVQEMVCITPTAAYPSHKWGGWKTVKQATCTQTGQRMRVCDRCGTQQTETIPQTSHSFGGWIVTSEPTCQYTGSRYRACSICGATQTETIPKADHKYGKWTVTKEATCTEEGERWHRCYVCGYVQETKIKKAEHSWGEMEILEAATCKTKGSQKHTCTVCGEEETLIIKVNPDAHAWGDWKVNQEATCLKAGSHTHVCTLCGKKETEKIQPLGHDFGPWEILTPAGPDSLGMRQHTCSRCGETEVEAFVYQGTPGLELSAGEVTRLEPQEGYTDVYQVEMTLKNTGDIALHYALDLMYGNGSNAEVITDAWVGYDPYAENILQPGEIREFQYLARTSGLYFDGDMNRLSRLVYAGGWSEETGLRAYDTASILIFLPVEEGLQLTVDNLHREGEGKDQVLTFDLTVTNRVTGISLIKASCGQMQEGKDGFINWPSDGLLLSYDESYSFSYFFSPTEEEVKKAAENPELGWVQRYITVEDIQGHSAVASLCAALRTPQYVQAHLDGNMEKPEFLSENETLHLQADLTLENLSDTVLTDPVVRGALMTGNGSTLRTFDLVAETGTSVLNAGESALFHMTDTIGPEDELAALAEAYPMLRYVFWGEYSYEHPEEGTASGESNLWQQSIPVWNVDVSDPKLTYIIPVLTGSFEDRVYHPGEKVWIDLTLENVNPEDTIDGVRFEWFPVDENGDISEDTLIIDMPELTLMPGESYTLKHRYSFEVDQEEALKGVYILCFSAWCHSAQYEWNSNSSWTGMIRMEPDESEELSVDIILQPYYDAPSSLEINWTSVDAMQSGSTPSETDDQPDGSFTANVSIGNHSDQSVTVDVASDHEGELLDGMPVQQVTIPAHDSVTMDYSILPSDEETEAGYLVRTVTATALEGVLRESGTLSFKLRGGEWHLDTDMPGLTLTAGEITPSWDEENGVSMYIADVTVENTGDLPLSLYVETRDGSGAEAWDDVYDGWGDGVDLTAFQPGESFTFSVIMTENDTDLMDGVFRRTLNVGGTVEETGACVGDSVSYVFPVMRSGALQLVVNGHHRKQDDPAITADLTLTNASDETVTVTLAAQDGTGETVTGDSLTGWPEGGSVTLEANESIAFGYVIHPTEDEIQDGEVMRMIIADGGEEPYLDFVNLVYPLVMKDTETALVHLEGEMTSAAPLALYESFEAYLTAVNLGNTDAEDITIHGVAQSADGKILGQLSLGASGAGLITAPGEGVQAFPAFPVTPEMAAAALSAHSVNEYAEAGAVTFTFWAQYTRRYADGWLTPAVSNMVSFTVPIQEDKSEGIFLSGLTNFSSTPGEGDPVDIALVVENIGKEDLVGLRLDAQREEQNHFTDWLTLINEPLDILHPGDKRPYNFHYTITEEDVEKGVLGFRFVASSESGVRPMMYVSVYEGGLLLTPPEESEGSVTIVKYQDNLPPNGQDAFREGDVISYTIELTNLYDFPVTGIAVYDEVKGYSPVIVGVTDIDSWKTVKLPYTHTVTLQDVTVQQVENNAYARVLVNDPETGEALEDTTITSNPVFTPVEEPEKDEDEEHAVTVTKTATNEPAGGYQEGEIILYDLVVYNGHDMDVDIHLWDYVHGDKAPEHVDAVTMSSGETRNFSHSHTVNAEDVKNGFVTNEAYAAVLLLVSGDNMPGYTAWADPVTVTVAQKDEETEVDLIPPVTAGADTTPETPPDTTPAPAQPQQSEGVKYCRRVLKGISDSQMQYELIFCSEHRDTASQAESPEEAREAWTQSVNQAYDELMTAFPDAWDAIETERTLFFDQLEVHEAFLKAVSGESRAMDAITMQLKERCIDLCYALHTVPAKRLDSQLQNGISLLAMTDAIPDQCIRDMEETKSGYQVLETVCREHLSIPAALTVQLKAAQTPEERVSAFRDARKRWQAVEMKEANRLYPACTAEAKGLLANDLNMFQQWLLVRQNLLLALYSGNEETAEEVLAFMVRTRAMEYEELAQE